MHVTTLTCYNQASPFKRTRNVFYVLYTSAPSEANIVLFISSHAPKQFKINPHFWFCDKLSLYAILAKISPNWQQPLKTTRVPPGLSVTKDIKLFNSYWLLINLVWTRKHENTAERITKQSNSPSPGSMTKAKSPESVTFVLPSARTEHRHTRGVQRSNTQGQTERCPRLQHAGLNQIAGVISDYSVCVSSLFQEDCCPPWLMRTSDTAEEHGSSAAQIACVCVCVCVCVWLRAVQKLCKHAKWLASKGVQLTAVCDE